MKKRFKSISFIFIVVLLMTIVPIFKTQAAHIDYSHGSIGLDTSSGKSYSSSNTSRIFVKGWAFSDKGVSSVTCDIGGVVIANLKYGTNRPDVNKKYTNCKTDKVGYEGYVPMNRIPRGKQTINVKVNLIDNTKMSLSFTVNVKKKDNITCIDYPQNSAIKNELTVRGWALNDSGVKNVGIFIDGKWVKNANYGSSRPDVNKVFPGYSNGSNSGYTTTTINVANIKPGKHKLMVVAVGNDGSRQGQERDLTISRKEARISLDAPLNNSGIKDSVTITGWSLDDSGRKSVDIYVNNKKYSTFYNVKGCWKIYRPDVNKIFPNYPQGDNSGFTRTLNTTSWADGIYKIKVVSTGIDGTVVSSEKTVIKGVKPDRFYLDEPKGGTSVKNSIHVRGWILTDSSVKSIKFYMDNNYIKDISYGKDRSDVNKIYPGYPSGNNCGFEETVSIPSITTGSHSVKLVVTLSNGTTKELTSSVIKTGEKTGDFETNIAGSTGWVAHACYLRDYPNDSSNYSVLNQGTVFRILKEQGAYWQVVANGKTGWVKYQYCMINLPDVLPSIVYNITNANSSIFRSSGYNVPNITGKNIYKVGKVRNNKIGRDEYIAPMLYSVAKKVALVQKDALSQGYCLKIYDTYRPSEVSRNVRDNLRNLYNSNATVRNGINYSYGKSGAQYSWGQGWFIAQSISAHNTGSAMDVTLVYNNNKSEVKMPSAMHELSTQAIKYYSGSCAATPSNYAKDMTEGAKKLDSLFTNRGFNTLASEWWHFQDTSVHNTILSENDNAGCEFYATSIVSTPN